MKFAILAHEVRKCLGPRKTATTIIIGVAISCGTDPVDAIAIKQLVIEDVGSTVGSAYSAALDGNSGGFSFQLINPATYVGATGFNTDTEVPMTWQGIIQGPGVFTSGFNFGGITDVDVFTYGTINSAAPGSPFTGTGANGDITGGVLTISSLDWGAGPLSTGTLEPYPLSPDPGTLQVNWVEPGLNANESLVSFQWSHLITTAEDPSGAFVGFNTNWILEGTATVVAVPPAALLMASGLTGLATLSRRRRRKKDNR